MRFSLSDALACFVNVTNQSLARCGTDLGCHDEKCRGQQQNCIWTDKNIRWGYVIVVLFRSHCRQMLQRTDAGVKMPTTWQQLDITCNIFCVCVCVTGFLCSARHSLHYSLLGIATLEDCWTIRRNLNPQSKDAILQSMPVQLYNSQPHQ